jgi:Fic family protein
MPNSEELLKGTPYLIGNTPWAAKQFRQLLTRSTEIQSRAERVGQRIREQAGDVFASFGLILRSELIAESNRMEYFDWTAEQVRDEVMRYRELLKLPVHTFLESVRADARVYEAIGLYRAQLLAEEWAESDLPPREIEIRQLHGLITAGAHYAGRYKIAPNEITGSNHRPPAPAEAAEGMHILSGWWEGGTGYPMLDATIVHAWLAHLHPFEDGNGRMARLLANLSLSQNSYPPLIIQADSDRGEYYDALASSDDGDILPLFELFTRVLRRAVRRMDQPDYVENVIRDRMLVTPSQQHRLWQALAQRFARKLTEALGHAGLRADVQGYPSAAGFLDMANGNPDGNTWFLKVMDNGGRVRWLLWFGFNSREYCDVFNEQSGYPSIFLSVRNEDPEASHPYSPLWGDSEESLWTELVLIPGRQQPARLLVGSYAEYDWQEYTIEGAASEVARLFAATNRDV